MPIGAVAAVGMVGSAAISSRAAGRAARGQENAARDAADLDYQASQEALAENRRQFDLSRADSMPWMDAGRNALGRLGSMSFNPGEFEASPDYEFVRGEGMRGIERSFAGRGAGQSGNALRALSDFNTGKASGEYNNWWQRQREQFNDQWNQQAGLAGVGQATASNLSSLGANYAASNSGIMTGSAERRGNALMGGADARASGIVGSANAWGNAISGIGNAGMYYAMNRPNRLRAY